jgi:uncharacterized tellurite resistance protein B-like protein
MSPAYQLGLLCLSHLLIGVDGEVHPDEKGAFEKMRIREKISTETFQQFETIVAEKKERDLYNHSIGLINQCTDDEKLRVFAMLYKLSEVDGRVHVKEIRLLLYSIKLVSIEFTDVVSKANSLPPLL